MRDSPMRGHLDVRTVYANLSPLYRVTGHVQREGWRIWPELWNICTIDRNPDRAECNKVLLVNSEGISYVRSY